MLKEFASTLIFGKPLFLWVGVTTMTCMLITIALGLLVIRGKAKFNYHKRMAYVTLAVGVVHGILVTSVFF